LQTAKWVDTVVARQDSKGEFRNIDTASGELPLGNSRPKRVVYSIEQQEDESMGGYICDGGEDRRDGGKRYPSYFVFKKILTESGVIIYFNLFRIDGYGVKVDALPFATELRKSTSLPDPGWEGANDAIPFAQGMSLKSWTKAQETTLCDQWKNASYEEVDIRHMTCENAWKDCVCHER
jgi:hypothetical protein